MFKPHRIVSTTISLLLFCVPLVFLKTSSQSLPQAKLFVEGVINTDADEYGPAFTSDGKTLYFTRRVNRRDSELIYVSRLEGGKWTAPELAPFSGKYFDKEPFVAPDGQRIFFASLRPVDGVEPKNRRDFNIWFVEKTASGWSEPKHAGPAVNSSAYENYPSVASNGTLYFAGEREGGKGGNDLYRARLVNGKYEQVERLDELNTPNVDADPYIAPDESYLIFCSDRGGGFGSGDLYISFNRNGRWTEPKNLGATINTPDFEYTPLISPDGKWLFLSRGWGEIYHIDWKAPDPAVENDRSAVPKPAASSAAQASQNVAVASAIIPGGESLTLPSKILGENRTVIVSLPASYPRGVQSYPVLYLTDAQPIIINVDGQEQLVEFMYNEIIGVDPKNGAFFWSHPISARWDFHFNISTPVWGADNLLFAAAAYGIGGRVLRLTRSGGKTVVKELWQSERTRVHKENAIRVGDVIYASTGHNGPAFFTAIEVKTGRVLWQDRRFSHANFLYADGRFIILDEDGALGLATPAPDGLTVHSKVQMLTGRSYTVPTMVARTLFLRDRKNIMALRL